MLWVSIKLDFTLKSQFFFTLVDFLYFAEVNDYQKNNIYTFQAIAQELSLKGLIGNENSEETEESNTEKLMTEHTLAMNVHFY